jgi:hypothetical protein
MVGSLGITCFGTTHQALGVASLTSGNLDRAIDHLRRAVQQNLVLAHWPAVIASRRRLAQALQLRGRPADGAAARCELDSATSEAAALGLPVLGLPVLSLSGPGQPAARDRVPGRPGPSGPVAECHRVGRKWRLTVHGRSVLVADSIGMIHMAVLIANPRQEVRAADLVAGLAGLSRASGGDGPAQAVLDHEAIAEYRDRLKRLDAELGQPDPGDDPGRVARARAERDWLIAQLAGAAGLGGRTWSFPDQGGTGPGSGGEGHPPGHHPGHRGGRDRRRASAPGGPHRSALLLLARLSPRVSPVERDGTAWTAFRHEGQYLAPTGATAPL